MRATWETRYSGDARRVQRYFDAVADNFNAIYLTPRFVDRLFRKDMYDRFRRTMDACHPVTGKTVLDIGCGSGQYAIALAQAGASRVVGLDFARRMVTIAADNAVRAGVSDRCTFVSGDFLSHPFQRRFDYCLAVGLFDYVSDPTPFLKKVYALTGEKFIATFPRSLTWRAPIRRIRLHLKRCPVFFYSRRVVTELMAQGGFAVSGFEACGKLFWITGVPAGKGL